MIGLNEANQIAYKHLNMEHSMNPTLFQSVLERARARLSSFIYNQINPPPFIFFTVFTYFHSPLSHEHQDFPLLLYIFALAVLFTSNFNFLFTMVLITNTHPAIAVATFLCSLILSNQRWKVYIFILTVGDNVFTQPNPKTYFLSFFPLIICVEIYRTLFFRNIGDNKQFFAGMASISAYYTIQILANNLALHLTPTLTAILVITAASFSLSLIESRINKLRHTDPKQIYSDLQMAHYLRMVEQDILDPFLNKLTLKIHSKNCKEPHCFCQNQEINHQVEYLIRQLYKDALSRFKKPNDSLLFQQYISFLIKNDQIINAIHFLDLWKPSSYFEMIGRMRSKARIQHLISDLNSFNPYEHQYTFPLYYDRASAKVAFEINAVIKLKLQFWGEINKVCPKVAQLQKVGYQIIERMYELNVFYSEYIKKYEQNIFLFDSTAVYAMYMLSTTNFKEYAELIIKNAAKLLEEVYVSESRASETFAIRTVVRKEKISFISNPKQHLQPLKRLNLSQQNKSGYKLIIDLISSGLCKTLGINKSELINHELNSIIPDGYKEVHNVRLSHLLDFDGKSISEIVPSKVLHTELKLPMKGANNRLLMAYICIKFEVDLEQGLTLVSVVKLTHDKCHRALMDFDGNVTECDPDFNKQILQHSEVEKYLRIGQQTWVEHRLIKEQKFNLVINKSNYGITINSPLTVLFVEKQNLKKNCPPFHIEIINEETNRNRTAEDDKNNKIGMQIKHMEMAIYNYDAESSTNSSSKGGSAAVNVMNSFLQTNTTPLYRFLQLVFLMTITCCVLSNIGTFYVTDLPWDSSVATHNPINDTMNFYALQMLTVKSLLLLGDQQYYAQHPSLNKTRISQYFGYADYEESLVQLTSKLEHAFKASINNLLRTPSVLLQHQVQKKLSEEMGMLNPVQFNSIYSTVPQQNLTYLEILQIYATDINLLANRRLNSTIFAYSFSTQISAAQNASYLSAFIDQAVAEREKLSIGIHAGLMGLVTLIIIPLCILLNRRLQFHEKVFDILASIDPGQVSAEIKSLRYILNILRNYKQSNEIMKTNVLGYSQNVLHPNRRESKASADNKMILGLSKYDHSIENKLYEARDEVQRQSLPMMANKESMLSFMEKTFTPKEQGEEVRKRPGELDLADSTLDPNARVRPKNCLLYAISLTFLAIFGFSLYYHLQFNAAYLLGKRGLLQAYNSQALFQGEIITSRVLFIHGTTLFAQFFGRANPLQLIYPMLESFPPYNYQDTSLLYSETISRCYNSTQLPSSFLQKYCEYDYSSLLLLGEFGAIFKQLVELRYNLDNNLTNIPHSSALQNIFEKVYYLQSLSLRLEELVLTKINLVFDLIVQMTREYQSAKLTILGISVLWGVVCCVLGVRIIVGMKEEYFKEVFMITFLNNEMILRNKRVESFIESISKTNSP